jgi:predicted hotdog family 3-hydroxylacyl-ACP dehydratase
MPLDRVWIEDHIPHHGSMCLLEEVIAWDTERVTCRAVSHRSPENPLRSRGRLGVVCGIEYAAQAMAAHGALTAASHDSAAPQAGFLAGIRGVAFHVMRLDDVREDLICHAQRVAGDSRSALYEFQVCGGTAMLLGGRATVVLDAGGRLTL